MAYNVRVKLKNSDNSIFYKWQLLLTTEELSKNIITPYNDRKDIILKN